ncbi:hypothetical protein SAY87_010545 [Trapa incisa]|uniref:Uncharacterized protein n=1 Tax=Trapa incisa TaxID=236973 RepID=A0AAN7JIG6_9MYRT|nr:hypothetical protein SAY87_010545 [Trapa incisa]
MKRKRGRPRKAEGSSSGEAENQHYAAQPLASSLSIQRRNNQLDDGKLSSLDDGDGKTKIMKEDGSNNGNNCDSMLGEIVHGVIDADIGDGYLFSFMFGEIYMKGVALKSSRVAPITATNDVAPRAKMFLRRDIPLPNINQHIQAIGEEVDATKPNCMSNQRINQNETQNQSLEGTPTLNEGGHVLVKKPNEDFMETEEDPKSDYVSESLGNMESDEEVQAVVSALKSAGSGPIQVKVKNVDLKHAPEPMPFPPKSPTYDRSMEVHQNIPMVSNLKSNSIITDKVNADLQLDEIFVPAKSIMETSIKNSSNSFPILELHPSAEVTLSLGLNQPCISSEVQNQPTSLEPKKSKMILDGGFNLNVDSYQSTIPTDTGSVMFFGPVFDLSGSSVGDIPTPSWQDGMLNIPSRDDEEANIGVEHVCANASTIDMVERFVTHEGD